MFRASRQPHVRNRGFSGAGARARVGHDAALVDEECAIVHQQTQSESFSPSWAFDSISEGFRAVYQRDGSLRACFARRALDCRGAQSPVTDAESLDERAPATSRVARERGDGPDQSTRISEFLTLLRIHFASGTSHAAGSCPAGAAAQAQLAVQVRVPDLARSRMRSTCGPKPALRDSGPRWRRRESGRGQRFALAPRAAQYEDRRERRARCRPPHGLRCGWPLKRRPGEEDRPVHRRRAEPPVVVPFPGRGIDPAGLQRQLNVRRRDRGSSCGHRSKSGATAQDGFPARRAYRRRDARRREQQLRLVGRPLGCDALLSRDVRPDQRIRVTPAAQSGAKAGQSVSTRANACGSQTCPASGERRCVIRSA